MTTRIDPIPTGDRYTDLWQETNTGQDCLRRVTTLKAGGIMLSLAAGRIIESDLVEGIYSRLPSGDYGRGDVRRVLRVGLGLDPDRAMGSQELVDRACADAIEHFERTIRTGLGLSPDKETTDA